MPKIPATKIVSGSTQVGVRGGEYQVDTTGCVEEWRTALVRKAFLLLDFTLTKKMANSVKLPTNFQ
nr:hypothetical protein [Providencia stuartii]